MSEVVHMGWEEAAKKIKELVDDINICIFCSDRQKIQGGACRPMGTQGVDKEGNIWFFSSKDSNKNKEISKNNQVELYYSHPGKSSFLVVSGEAEILFDKQKIAELWNPLDKTWFTAGKEDPRISIIKVKPAHAHYWDTKGNKMINFLKMVASVATGKNRVNGEEGKMDLQ
jgi:general stress protein 26